MHGWLGDGVDNGSSLIQVKIRTEASIEVQLKHVICMNPHQRDPVKVVKTACGKMAAGN